MAKKKEQKIWWYKCMLKNPRLTPEQRNKLVNELKAFVEEMLPKIKWISELHWNQDKGIACLWYTRKNNRYNPQEKILVSRLCCDKETYDKLVALKDKDPNKLLIGTGNLIRHIPMDTSKDYRNKKVKDLVKSAIDFAIQDMEKPTKLTGETISKD